MVSRQPDLVRRAVAAVDSQPAPVRDGHAARAANSADTGDEGMRRKVVVVCGTYAFDENVAPPMRWRRDGAQASRLAALEAGSETPVDQPDTKPGVGRLIAGRRAGRPRATDRRAGHAGVKLSLTGDFRRRTSHRVDSSWSRTGRVAPIPGQSPTSGSLRGLSPRKSQIARAARHRERWSASALGGSHRTWSRVQAGPSTGRGSLMAGCHLR